MNTLLIIFGLISIGYDATLILLNPGTFWDNVFSFSHIWLVLGAYLIFVAIYRIKTKHSFWSIWKKWIKLTVVSLGAIAAIISIINLTLILNPAVVGTDEKAEHVILLGGGISKDGVLPKSVISRVEKAAEYLNKNPESICVVTGGTLDWLPYAEAPELKRQLIARGISADRILVEDQALDTIQNFQLSCKMLAEFKNVTVQEILDTPTAVVTSRFHLRRSERLARRMGFTNIKGIPAKCPPVYIIHSYVREICAYVKLNLRILLTGEPKKIQSSLL
ncbi:MAG: YdcF family protein [Treponema sp.]|nr:YdcF family protein [Treponema sp.]